MFLHSVIVEAVSGEADTESLLGLIKTAHSLLGLVKQEKNGRAQQKGLKRQLIRFGLLERLLQQCKVMLYKTNLTEDGMECLAQATRMIGVLSKSRLRLKRINDSGHSKTVLQLCKCADKRVRRGAAKVLMRLSILDEWKALVTTDSETLTGIFSLCKTDDTTIQMCAGPVLAEMAELPANRVAMEKEGAIPCILHLLRLDIMLLNRDCMRALALLAQAVANRSGMMIRCLDAVLDMLWSNDTLTQDFAVRLPAPRMRRLPPHAALR